MAASPGFVERGWHWWLSRVAVPFLVALIAAAVGLYIGVFRNSNTGDSEGNSAITSAESSNCANNSQELTGGWGPDRPTVGTVDYAPQPSFNVDRYNSVYGDERNFLVVKELSHTIAGGWADRLEVLPNQTYRLRLLVHNGARDQDENVAENTTIHISIPACAGSSIAIFGFITATNAFPGTIYDGIVLNSDRDFRVEFVPGSAKFYSNNFTDGTDIPDRIFMPSGMRIGSPDLDSGLFRGDYVNSGVIVAEIRTTPA
ncbi:hypothetical protein ACEWX3_10570 [Mycobacterium sp. G7A2]|uniref:hypothetical protein n=1 Tax=Mycobacterium sp. G7A2 TaxID=3317307 RepID=UPI0035A92825